MQRRGCARSGCSRWRGPGPRALRRLGGWRCGRAGAVASILVGGLAGIPGALGGDIPGLRSGLTLWQLSRRCSDARLLALLGQWCQLRLKECGSVSADSSRLHRPPCFSRTRLLELLRELRSRRRTTQGCGRPAVLSPVRHRCAHCSHLNGTEVPLPSNRNSAASFPFAQYFRIGVGR